MQNCCAIHRSMPLSHFCESCNDAVCEDCFKKQPHSGETHKIKTLQESANIRRNHYVHYLNEEIHPLRKAVENKINDFSEEGKKFENEKQVIEKDIRIEYEMIEDRLNEGVEKLIYSKQTQIKHYQLFLNSIDDLIETYEKCFEHPQAFLLAFRMFDSEIRKLQSLEGVQKNEDSQKIEMKREISEIYQKIQTKQQLENNNIFMNKLINEFVKNYKKELKEENEKAEKKGKQIKLLYNEKCMNLRKDKKAKICIFCGVPFSIDNVNEGCPNNRSFKMKTIYPDVNFESIIPEQERGSRRHYWYGSKSEHRSRPDMNSHSLLRKTLKKHYFNGLNELQQLKYRIEGYEIREGKKMEDLFVENDKEKNGRVTKIAFTYLMNKILDVPQEQIETLINLIGDEKGIEYIKMREIIENPLEDYSKFVQEQEQLQKAKPVGPNSGSLFSKFKY